MTPLALLFGFQGRLNRLGFWQGVGINLVFLALCANLLPRSAGFSLYQLAPLALSALSLCALGAKRLHDRNRSAHHLWLAAVLPICIGIAPYAQGTMAWLLGIAAPFFIGTLLFLDWGIFQGQPDANRYGKQGESLRIR